MHIGCFGYALSSSATLGHNAPGSKWCPSASIRGISGTKQGYSVQTWMPMFPLGTGTLKFTQSNQILIAL